jgi:hypothetical protein
MDADGESVTDLKNNRVEYYKFVLTANTLSKQVLNNQTKVAHGRLDKVVIVAAEDLNSTDFACMKSTDGNITNLKFEFDSQRTVLNLSSSDGSSIILNTLSEIFFGNTKRDVNMCDLSTNYYFADSLPDLTKSNVTISLQNKKQDVLRNITLNLAILEDGNLNIHWTFSNFSGVKAPFEVPQSIVKKNKVD